MANRLKAYVRRTILESAREYSYPCKRRTREGTRAAFVDAMRGTDTGWWTDLIYTAGMLQMAHRYRTDIATALSEYEHETGQEYQYRPGYGEPDIGASHILSALLVSGPWSFSDYQDDPRPARALIGLRFAVEWYAGELAREYCPDI